MEIWIVWRLLPALKFLSHALLFKNAVLCNETFLYRQGKLAELEAELLEINGNNEKLQHAYNELFEYKLVLEKV